jgi:hypothetical protein
MSRRRDAQKLQDALMRSAATPQRCILCDRPAECRGMFFPDRPSEYGAPPGKARVFIYAICADCWDRPTTVARVEAYIREKALSKEPQRWN